MNRFESEMFSALVNIKESIAKIQQKIECLPCETHSNILIGEKGKNGLVTKYKLLSFRLKIYVWIVLALFTLSIFIDKSELLELIKFVGKIL